MTWKYLNLEIEIQVSSISESSRTEKQIHLFVLGGLGLNTFVSRSTDLKYFNIKIPSYFPSFYLSSKCIGDDLIKGFFTFIIVQESF